MATGKTHIVKDSAGGIVRSRSGTLPSGAKYESYRITDEGKKPSVTSRATRKIKGGSEVAVKSRTVNGRQVRETLKTGKIGGQPYGSFVHKDPRKPKLQTTDIARKGGTYKKRTDGSSVEKVVTRGDIDRDIKKMPPKKKS